MTDTYGHQYIALDGEGSDAAAYKEDATLRNVAMALVRKYDLTQPTCVQLERSEVPVRDMGVTIGKQVRYRLQVRPVERLEQTFYMPRMSEYDRSLAAIAWERLQMRWQGFKRWWRA